MFIDRIPYDCLFVIGVKGKGASTKAGSSSSTAHLGLLQQLKTAAFQFYITLSLHTLETPLSIAILAVKNIFQALA